MCYCYLDIMVSFLGEWNDPSFEHTRFSFIQGCFVPNVVEIGPKVLENNSR